MKWQCLCPGRECSSLCPLVPVAIYVVVNPSEHKLGEKKKKGGGVKEPLENISDLNELCVGKEYPAYIIFAF